MTTKRAALVWQDAQGEQVLHLMNTASGVSSIRTQLLLKSNALVSEESEGDLVLTNGTPSVLTYPTVRTNAVLLFKDSRTNSNARLYIPAPLSTVFDGSGDTVDPAAISAIISAAIGNLVAGSGNTVDMFVGGYLGKVRPQPLEMTEGVVFVNPMTSTGDMIYATDNVGDYARLPIGSTGQVLEVVGGIPTWAAPSGLSVAIPSGRAQGTGSGDYTTASTTFTDVDTSNLTVSIAAAAGDILQIGCMVPMVAGTGTMAITLSIGGTTVGDTLGLYFAGAAIQMMSTILYQHVVTSGQISSGHVVVKPRYLTTAGTATIYNRTAVARPYLTVTNLRQ